MNRSIDQNEWIEAAKEGNESFRQTFFDLGLPEEMFQTPITVVYRDKESLGHARRLYNQLQQRCGVGSFQLKEWPHAALEDSVAFAFALEDAAESDVLLLALHSEDPLSPALKQWITRLSERQTRSTSAVVGCFLNRSDQPVGVIAADEEIHALLKPADMEYVSGAVRRQVANEAHVEVAPVVHGFLETAVVRGQRPDLPPAGHWGINE